MPRCFSTSKSTWGGFPALKTGKVFVLFTKINSTAPTEPQTAIWYFGFHVVDVRKNLATYQHPTVAKMRSKCPSPSDAVQNRNDAMRIMLSDGLSRLILAAGVVWGSMALFLAYISSFAAPLGNGDKEVTDAVIALSCLLVVLPTTIAAFWIPKISCGLLVLSFAIFECWVVREFGYKAVVPVALRLGSPTFALAGGYL